MCKLAHVIRYTVLSQNFHFCCFRAMAYIRLWNWVQFCLFNGSIVDRFPLCHLVGGELLSTTCASSAVTSHRIKIALFCLDKLLVVMSTFANVKFYVHVDCISLGAPHIYTQGIWRPLSRFLLVSLWWFGLDSFHKLPESDWLICYWYT